MSIGEFFHPLLTLIAQGIVFFRNVFAPVFGKDSGWAWALAIVMVTVVIRLLVFPLFVKQIKTQRAMQELSPKIKALQAKHKGDKETLNAELMKLYREHGTNPLAGCLPILLQMPILISFFQVLNQLRPSLSEAGALQFPEKFGMSAETAQSLGQAKLFGAPIAAGLNSPANLLSKLSASKASVTAIAVTLIVAMVVTQFVTTKQMMSRQVAAVDSQAATQQKVMLYVLPVMFGLFGFGVPIGTLVYWTTTNFFSMGQQYVILHHLGEATPAKPGKPAAAKPAVDPPRKTSEKPKPGPLAPPTLAVDGPTVAGTPPPSSNGSGTAKPRARSGANRSAKRKKGRRGGRR